MMVKPLHRPMRVLLVHRFYWPDVTGYAQMLPIMARSFAEAGYDVSVFSTQPSYNDAYQGKLPPAFEKVDGVTVRRIWLPREKKNKLALRALNVVFFCARLLLHCLWHRYDVITVSTFPPTAMAFVARFLKRVRGVRYLYHCQDLYPEVALASGLTRVGWLSHFASSVDRQNCQKADIVVVLSEDMKQTIANRGVDTRNVRIINNFVIEPFQPVADMPQELKLDPNKFSIIFAGNMGRFQGLENLMEAAHLLSSESRVQFVFVGGGALTEKLKVNAGPLLNKSVFFYPHQPLDRVMQMIHDSKLSVVSLGPGVIRTAYPSKTTSYLEAGARLLVIMEDDCELSRFVSQSDVGVCCPQDDPERIAEIVRQELDRPAHDRNHSRQVGQKSFGQETILAKWHAVLGELQAGHART